MVCETNAATRASYAVDELLNLTYRATLLSRKSSTEKLLLASMGLTAGSA